MDKYEIERNLRIWSLFILALAKFTLLMLAVGFVGWVVVSSVKHHEAAKACQAFGGAYIRDYSEFGYRRFACIKAERLEKK